MVEQEIIIVITKAEAEEILDLIYDELGDPLVGRKVKLINSARHKIREALSKK
ncbi:MAG: hypothetical protein V1851_02875 [Patescibacteria group bacterium]